MSITSIQMRSATPGSMAPPANAAGARSGLSLASVSAQSAADTVQVAQPVVRLAAPPASVSGPVAAPATSAEALKDTVQELQKALQKSAPGLQFSIDEDGGDVIVKLVDTVTGDVVRQFPSEEMLQIFKSIEKMQGLLVNKTA